MKHVVKVNRMILMCCRMLYSRACTMTGTFSWQSARLFMM